MKLRKCLHIILLFYFIFLNTEKLAAQRDSLRAVVFDFKVEIKTNENLSTNLRSFLEEDLDLEFKILNRAEIAKIMEEKKRRQDLKPLFNHKTAIKEGEFFEARYSIVGKIFNFFDKPYISVKLIDNQTTVQISTSKELSEIDAGKIRSAMQEIANTLSNKHKQRNTENYSTVTVVNKTNKQIAIGDNIIEPNTEPIKLYLEAGKELVISNLENSEEHLYINKNTYSQVEISENKGEVIVETTKHKIFMATDLTTFLNVKSNWLAELGYYYHLKDGLYLGLSVNGLSIPYNVTYSTFQNTDSITVAQVSRDYFINILLRRDYFIKRHVGKTVYGELNVGASFINLHPKIQLKGGIELNEWISIELGYQLHKYFKKEIVFNPYGNANNNLTQTWGDRLLFNFKINHQF